MVNEYYFGICIDFIYWIVLVYKKIVMLMVIYEKIFFNLRYIFVIEIEEIYIVISIKKENIKFF